MALPKIKRKENLFEQIMHPQQCNMHAYLGQKEKTSIKNIKMHSCKLQFGDHGLLLI